MSEPLPLADDPAELTDEGRRALSAGLVGPRVPAGARDAVWQALGVELASAAAAASAPALSLGVIVKQLALGGVLGALVATGLAVSDRLGSEPRSDAPSSSASRSDRAGARTTALPGPASTTSAVPAAVAPSGEPSATLPRAARGTASAVAPAPGAASATGANGTGEAAFPIARSGASLDESQRLSEARARLRAGRPHEALQLLRDVAVHHPHGVLVQEREAMTIDALVASGDRVLARRRAEAFIAQYPESPYTDLVRRALR